MTQDFVWSCCFVRTDPGGALSHTVHSHIQTLVIVHDGVDVLHQVSAVNKVSTDSLYVIASLMPALLCQSQKVAVIPQ